MAHILYLVSSTVQASNITAKTHIVEEAISGRAEEGELSARWRRRVVSNVNALRRSYAPYSTGSIIPPTCSTYTLYLLYSTCIIQYTISESKTFLVIFLPFSPFAHIQPRNGTTSYHRCHTQYHPIPTPPPLPSPPLLLEFKLSQRTSTDTYSLEIPQGHSTHRGAYQILSSIRHKLQSRPLRT